MFIILFGVIISGRSNAVPQEFEVGGVYAMANT